MINAKNTQRLGKLLALFNTPKYEVTVLDATNEFKLVVTKNGQSVQLRNDVYVDNCWIDIFEHKPLGSRLDYVSFDQVKETVDRFLSNEVQIHRVIELLWSFNSDRVDEYVTGVEVQFDGSVKIITRKDHVVIERVGDDYKVRLAGSSEAHNIENLASLIFRD